ncbi:hypothetical protein [Streptomyces sp. S3(2020)]|uniref:hypothetical protein n=1 Tax=Streptomyces sp. S3(2020) TaxID=2732044 RepID=UPI001F0ED6BB|nr:hypothetical protein [Streptomyces sp. S3(2020)]
MPASLSSNFVAVLRSLPADGLAEGVWQEDDGRIHSAIADQEYFPELTARMSRARAAVLLSMDACESEPLRTAVMPDNDGVLHARWRTCQTSW